MAGGTVRGAVVNATRMVGEMRANHNLGVVETLLLGHGYIAAALLTATLKGRDRISIQIQCSGPARGMDVEANVFGEVRGYLKNPRFSDRATGGESRLSPYLEDARTPYSGRIVMEHGNLAQDLAAYFLQSEQTPTAFNLSIHFDDRAEVAGAGGVLLQALPGALPGVLADAEEAVAAMPSPGLSLAGGLSPEDLAAEAFKRFEPVFMEHHRVEFFCRCTRERMAAHLTGLPRGEILEIRENGPFPLKIRCHNCNTVYTFSRQDLDALLADSPPDLAG
jgi:molecular chaperone Hsp33